MCASTFEIIKTMWRCSPEGVRQYIDMAAAVITKPCFQQPNSAEFVGCVCDQDSQGADCYLLWLENKNNHPPTHTYPHHEGVHRAHQRSKWTALCHSRCKTSMWVGDIRCHLLSAWKVEASKLCHRDQRNPVHCGDAPGFSGIAVFGAPVMGVDVLFTIKQTSWTAEDLDNKQLWTQKLKMSERIDSRTTQSLWR